MNSEKKHFTQLSAKRRWLSSEKIAMAVLEELGYKILDTRRKIELSGIEVGEIDIVVSDEEGNIYAVEVKAGKLDVTGIRQAYINALLLNAKPLVICKGFADDAAKELAEKLGVKTIQLSDVFLVESEELYTIMREVIEETLTEYLELFYGYGVALKQEHLDIVNAIYSSPTIEEAAEKLGIDVHTLAKRIEELRKQGIIPRWATKYGSIRRIAQILLHKQNITSAL
ncbi:MAG: YraN family protein, partial [Desulfurococcaceae archaeon]